MVDRWIGIDNGFSKMSMAILDFGEDVIALDSCREPLGGGHSRDIALMRLCRLLDRMKNHHDQPVRLAGYCYDHSGVMEVFREEGWNVQGCMPLNDVVGFYGLTKMEGHMLVGGCGSFSQVVYVDETNNVCWPGEDVISELPGWQISGWNYAEFLLNLVRSHVNEDFSWLRTAVHNTLDGGKLDPAEHRWGYLGPLLGKLAGSTVLEKFLDNAADAVALTRKVFEKHIGKHEPPNVVLGGGAVRDSGIWSALHTRFVNRGIDVIRAEGEPAVGLARFAACCTGANAWDYVGFKKPTWL